MTTALVTIGDETTTIEIIDVTATTEITEITGITGIGGDAVSSGQRLEYEIPRGMVSLHRTHITADPPRPEDLTNAIGEMMDHVDDALRELPLLSTATTVIVAGRAAEAIATVEVGRPIAADTFELSRAAAEDVFRTLVTEAADQRRRNPGLPADLIDTITAGCCAHVAIMRGLHLQQVTVQIGAGREASSSAAPG